MSFLEAPPKSIVEQANPRRGWVGWMAKYNRTMPQEGSSSNYNCQPCLYQTDASLTKLTYMKSKNMLEIHDTQLNIKHNDCLKFIIKNYTTHYTSSKKTVQK